MTDGPARVAAVGLGRWAKTLADSISHSDKIKIVNCFSRSEKNRTGGEESRCQGTTAGKGKAG